MAAADALTLAFSALMQLRFGMDGWNLVATLGYAGPTVLAAVFFAISVVFVYRSFYGMRINAAEGPTEAGTEAKAS